VRTATFIILFLLFPCFWYMVAVGGLLPLPVIVMYGFAGGILLAFSIVHLVVYAGIFFFVARRLRKPAVAAGVLIAVFALSFAPIYGGGENLASGGKLHHNAYQMYQQTFTEVFGARR
jgi:hypothetical protein